MTEINPVSAVNRSIYENLATSAYESFFIAAEYSKTLGITFLALVILVEMKLFSNDESEAKRGCAQFKEAAPQVRLNCPDETRISNDGKSVPKDLLQLSLLVGNPNTAESVWMNACIGAGNRSLAPKHGLIYKTLMSCKTSLGLTSIMLTLLLNFVLMLFLAAQAAYSTVGISVESFIHPFSNIDGGGMLTALMAGVCFWSSLLSRSSALRWFYLLISLLSLSVILVFGVSDLIGFGWALASAAAGITGVIGLWHAGALCRDALPKTFSAAKVAQSGLGMLTLPAILSAWIIYSAFTSGPHSTSYENGTSSTLWVLFSIVGYGLLAQGYAIGRASKSASRAACAFLGVCVQAPLLLGLLYAAGTSAIIGTMANFYPNFDPVYTPQVDTFLAAWKDVGLQRTGFMFAATLVTLVLAGAGGYLGAWKNSVLIKRKSSSGKSI